ncbi:MAG: KTSC domain-containing protein [Sphingomicrobium sp.]
MRYPRMTHPAIRGAWYLPNRRQLDLMFGSGRHYRYANVPAHVAHRFAEAASKGRFYNAEIRNSYACTQLDAELADVA